jgi:DNA transformation protein
MDRETAAELFAAFGPVDVRRVFSGFGLYADDVCFALYLRGEFYLKADETTIPRFVAERCEPFSYAKRAKTVSVKSWWRMPVRLYDEPEELAEWAREAVAVAAMVKLKKRARKTKQRANAKTAAVKKAAKPARGAAARSRRKAPTRAATRKVMRSKASRPARVR